MDMQLIQSNIFFLFALICLVASITKSINHAFSVPQAATLIVFFGVMSLFDINKIFHNAVFEEMLFVISQFALLFFAFWLGQFLLGVQPHVRAENKILNTRRLAWYFVITALALMTVFEKGTFMRLSELPKSLSIVGLVSLIVLASMTSSLSTSFFKSSFLYKRKPATFTYMLILTCGMLTLALNLAMVTGGILASMMLRTPNVGGVESQKKNQDLQIYPATLVPLIFAWLGLQVDLKSIFPILWLIPVLFALSIYWTKKSAKVTKAYSNHIDYIMLIMLSHGYLNNLFSQEAFSLAVTTIALMMILK